MTLPTSLYPAEPEIRAFFEQVVAKLRSDARVQSASAADGLPVGNFGATAVVTIEGRAATGPTIHNIAGRNIVTPGHFRTFAVPLLQGREFDQRDGADTQPLAIVKETMA